MQKDEVFQAWQEHQKLQAQAEAKAEAEADKQWLFDLVDDTLNELKKLTLENIVNGDKSNLSPTAKPFIFTFASKK